MGARAKTRAKSQTTRMPNFLEKKYLLLSEIFIALYLAAGCVENDVKYDTGDTQDGKDHFFHNIQKGFVTLISSSASGTVEDLLDCYMACRNTDNCDGVTIMLDNYEKPDFPPLMSN